jgi:hypothetical protein
MIQAAIGLESSSLSIRDDAVEMMMTPSTNDLNICIITRAQQFGAEIVIIHIQVL